MVFLLAAWKVGQSDVVEADSTDGMLVDQLVAM